MSLPNIMKIYQAVQKLLVWDWQYIPEDNSEHHTRRRENLKSHIVNLYGRLLYVVFDESNPFGSRKPSASAPYPYFCDSDNKAPFLTNP
jgi:hypothetical protein